VSVVVANGIEHHVQDLGAGSPVVMLHGLLIGSLASWYFTSAPALAKTHRVRVYDLRGHGRSALAATGYDVRTLAGDLGVLAGDAPVDLVGHSWGALVALRFAIDHPERVRRLVLVEAPLPPSSVSEMDAFVTGGDLGSALPAQMNIAGRRGERLVRALARLVRETSLVADLRAERDPDPAELARVRAPTLVVTGDRSSCAPGGERLAREIPGARLLVLPGGHYVHLDARDALTAAIVEHLDG
jgi:pimeloyl-ACP methyl ester carboxylesterase